MQFSLFVYIHFEYVWFYNFRFVNFPPRLPTQKELIDCFANETILGENGWYTYPIKEKSLELLAIKSFDGLFKDKLVDYNYETRLAICLIQELDQKLKLDHSEIIRWVYFLFETIYSEQFFLRILLFPYWTHLSNENRRLLYSFYWSRLVYQDRIAEGFAKNRRKLIIRFFRRLQKS